MCSSGKKEKNDGERSEKKKGRVPVTIACPLVRGEKKGGKETVRTSRSLICQKKRKESERPPRDSPLVTEKGKGTV